MDPVRCQSLGLGRGINVTDTHIWRNKSSLQMHEVLENVTVTEESGNKEEYEEEVATISNEQRKIALSLDDPTSHVRIGMDAQQIRTASKTVKISGVKVKTRTIAFTSTFSDIPRYSRQPRELWGASRNDSMDTRFEGNISTWIYEQILNRDPDEYLKQEKSSKSVSNGQAEADGQSASPRDLEENFKQKSTDPSPHKQLLEYLEKATNEKKKGIYDDCKAFVQNFGITHYVSAIELGAIEYQVVTSNSEKTKRKIGAEIGASQFASGELSASKEKVQARRSRVARMIGRIHDGIVIRNSDDEAVIGFQIRPVYKLVHNHILQSGLQRAVQSYILKRGDIFTGPFLISCTIGGEDAYWAIDVTSGRTLICGTEHPDEASQFYITPTGDATHPNEFLIAHWVGDRRQRKELQYPLNKDESSYRSKPVLPLYVSSGFNLGHSNGPLQLKPAVPVHQARFCLHNRVQTRYSFLMCRSTPVSHREWTEGEQFYINCSRQSLLIDGYVAMVKNDQIFQTTTLSFIKESNELGMLFRLNPPPPSAHTANEMTTYSNADIISINCLFEKNEDEFEPAPSESTDFEEFIEESIVDPPCAQTVTAEEVSRHNLQRGLTTHAQQFSRRDPEELIESSVDPPSAQTVTAEEVSRHDLQRGLTTHAQQFEQYFGNIDD